ncbi:MAG: hypothetical protein JRJ59_13130, partial [Deltaproteobacteria bacterium]|nr:hypothetical protein [Deltaproteobacteria bacterium]
YTRGEGNIPRKWVAWMKNSMSSVGRNFNMHRMLREYLHSFYLPQLEDRQKLLDQEAARLKDLMKLKEKIDAWWSKVKIKDYSTSLDQGQPCVEDEIEINCYVSLEGADSQLFGVEGIYCYGEEEDRLETIPLAFVEKYQDGVAKYSGTFSLKEPGLQELGVRLTPLDPLFRQTYPGYIKWAQ